MVIAMTGGRPQNLPWGTNENDPRCVWLKAELKQRVEKYIAKGAKEFICGMALGCDTFFAEAVLELKKTHDIRLVAALSCCEQSSRWKIADKQRFDKILAQCDACETASLAHTEGCERQRNCMMVDRCDVLIAVYNGRRWGGTAQTIKYAGVKDIPIDYIDLTELPPM